MRKVRPDVPGVALRTTASSVAAASEIRTRPAGLRRQHVERTRVHHLPSGCMRQTMLLARFWERHGRWKTSHDLCSVAAAPRVPTPSLNRWTGLPWRGSPVLACTFADERKGLGTVEHTATDGREVGS